MSTLKRLISSSLFVLFLFSTALAQESRAPVDTAPAQLPAAPLVTATATAKRVRFVSPGTVVQLRLEVYNEAGQKLFDTELRGGNVLDWHLQDGAGERVQAGSYACVLTIKGLSGRLSQRVGLVMVNDDKATVEAAGTAQLSTAQQQTVGPVEDNASLTILQEAEAITAVTHDGTDGQVTSTTGALTFRTGDVFAGKDKEQMRITEDGSVGIGTDKPQARLDVAGTIRAAKGIEFADGTVQTTGLSGRKDKDGNIIPNVTGTGTQNQISKWTDNSGALGNSIITELPSGFIGISNPNPTAKLSVSASTGAQLRFDQGAQGITPVLSVISQPESTTSGAAAILGAGTGGSSFVFSDNQPFYLLKDTKANVINNQLGNGTVLFTLLPTGNLGIGNTNPTSKLDVAGNINTLTQYNIGGLRVLSTSGTVAEPNTNTFAGVAAGASNPSAAGNSFFGSNAGVATMLGGYNSFFGYRAGEQNSAGCCNNFFGVSAGFYNNMGFLNSFFGHGAGLSNTTESNNTFVGAFSNGEAGTTNATAVGYRAKVTQSNSLVLGSINTVNGATASTNVGIGTTAPLARLDIQSGADSDGGTDASPTLAFSWRGGGFRHWIRTRHSASAAAGNAIDFFVNSSATADGSTGPGAGNQHVMSLDGGNVGIGADTPKSRLQVTNGDIFVNTIGTGLIIKSANGTCFRIIVSDAAVLSALVVVCPN